MNPPADNDQIQGVPTFVEALIAAADLGELQRPMRDVALALTRGGWPVFPCDPQLKKPLIDKGFHGRSKDIATVEGWWTAHPAATVGIVPADGGLIAVDADKPEDLASIQRADLLPDGFLTAVHDNSLDGRHGLVIATGGSSKPFEFNGYSVPPLHLYLKASGSEPPKLPGVVCRFDRGYVIAPGSLGRARYRLIGRGAPLPFRPAADVSLAVTRPVTNAPPEESLKAPDLNRLQQALNCIPNTSQTDRDQYVKIAHAIKGAVGPERDADGLDLFLKWAARWPGNVNPDEDERVYTTISHSNTRTGWESIWRLAAKYGFDATLEIQQDAQDAFAAEGTAVLTDPSGPAPNTGYTLGELLQRPELLTVPVPAIPFLAWPGLKTLLSAREKTGKSTFALAGAAAASRGARFLDEDTPPATVVWATEEPLVIIVQRAAGMGADENRFVILPMDANPPKQLLHAYERWKPQIVVIDTLYRYAMVEDENDAAAWLPHLRQLDEITRAGVALLMLVHATKSSTQGEYRGSTAIGGFVDVLLAMTGTGTGTTRVLKAVGRIPVTDYRVRLEDDRKSFLLETKGSGRVRINRTLCSEIPSRQRADGQNDTAAEAQRRPIQDRHCAPTAGHGWSRRPREREIQTHNGRSRLRQPAGVTIVAMVRHGLEPERRDRASMHERFKWQISSGHTLGSSQTMVRRSRPGRGLAPQC